MESLIPTLNIDIEEGPYTILEFTLNPIFNIKENILSFDKKFEVWIEFVLGHNSSQDELLPKIKLEFNEAFLFNDKHHPCIDDSYYQKNKRTTQNYSLYSYFWFNKIVIKNRWSKIDLDKLYDINKLSGDLLKSAYGNKSKRILPIDPPFNYLENEIAKCRDRIEIDRKNIKGALAFYRSDYYGNDYYNRINYPCSFNTENDRRNIILIPRIFNLKNLEPSSELVKISKEESISLWYYYSYGENTAQYIKDIQNESISFLHKIIFNCSFKRKFGINYFPRVPSRFAIDYSEPALITSPRLPTDPFVWRRFGDLYPLRPLILKNIESTNNNNRYWIEFEKDTTESPELIKQLDFFITLRDRRIEIDRGAKIIMLSIISTFLVGYLSASISDISYTFFLWFMIWSLTIFIVLGLIIFRGIMIINEIIFYLKNLKTIIGNKLKYLFNKKE